MEFWKAKSVDLQRCLFVAALVSLVLLGMPAIADEATAEYSQKTPLAQKSLLLDVTRAGKRLFVAGEYGHILYSNLAADDWQQAQVPTRNMLTALDFASAERGWAVGHDGMILATVDAGLHWTIQRDGLADQQRINRERMAALEQQIVDMRAGLVRVAGVEDRRAATLVLEDLVLDLEDVKALVEEPVHAPPLLDVFFSDEMNGYAIGAFNTLLITRDGGVTWLNRSDSVDNPDEYHLNAIVGDGQGKLWIAAEAGLLFHSSDAGATWVELASPYHGSWFGIVRDSVSGSLLVFGLRGNVFRSVDAGATWHAVAVPTDRSLAGGYFVNEQYVVLVGAVGTVLVSRDGGGSFIQYDPVARPNFSAVTASRDMAILVGQGGIQTALPFGASR